MIESILVSLIGLFIGGWINNVFTWKIKDKIENLDMLTESLTKIQLFIIKSSNTNRSREDSLVENIVIFKKSVNILLEFTTINELAREIFELLKIYTKTVEENNESALSIVKTQLNNLLDKLDQNTLTTRKTITSFNYMMKQFFIAFMVILNKS